MRKIRPIFERRATIIFQSQNCIELGSLIIGTFKGGIEANSFCFCFPELIFGVFDQFQDTERYP